MDHLIPSGPPSSLYSRRRTPDNATGNRLATLQKDHACPPCRDVSGVALLHSSKIHHNVYGEWQGSLEVQDCLDSIFNILQINPSIALHKQHEIDQILCMGEAPTRWTRSHHFPSLGDHALNTIAT